MAATDLSRRHPHAWEGKNVLITGHTGFIGTWLSMTLLHLGAQVDGFALDGERTPGGGAVLGDLGVKGTAGDVRDFASVQRAMAARDFDVVFHLAAQPLVSVGLADPWGTLTTNTGGSVNVLEAARLCRPGVLVHVTSDKCYRNREWPWPYREVDEIGGGCPYSVSKAAAELIFEAYGSLFRHEGGSVRAASVRFGNVIGGGDHAPRRLVPDVMAALRDGRPIELRRPSAVRPWQHVMDVVHGLLLLAASLADGSVEPGEVFNFAPPGDGATVQELVTALTRAWRAGGADVPVRAEGDGRFVEDELLRLDGRKAASALGWSHAFDLEAAACAIVEWERAVARGRSPADATSAQIHAFHADDRTARFRPENRLPR
ncbi:CDP-glucose 4,6-dehydratase [Sphaerisporangium rhizosphaerae]|uniref:CDP-glucose 4,6-dehydratase n=1 Tax=Sphaerisporangium rhizosphaerae TaxID=2269375 RepID=A0ABW2PC24_9ACTN